MDSTATRLRKYDLLGEVLLKSGRLSQADLDRALALKKSKGLKIGQALVELGLLTETEVVEALRRQGKMLCVDLTMDIVDKEVAESLGHEKSVELKALAFNRIAGVTTVAMSDPTELSKVDEVAMRLKTRVLAVYAESRRIDKCLNQVFVGDDAGVDKLQTIATSLENTEFSLPNFTSGGDETVEDPSLDKPVVNMVRSLIQEAYKARASDIHLEPRRDKFVVRFRVDGAMQERLCLEKVWARPALARLKVLSSLDLAQTRLPQDGRAQAEIDGRLVDLRVATTPTLSGEGAVIRILDGGREVKNLASLGFTDTQLESVRRMLACGDGFVLATGPTGSGKTTTLYAMLGEIAEPSIKIITLEDPVENQMDGITQINVNVKAGMTFAVALRSVLRQDPDVCLLGEIRDEETARIATQAALTGHLVLSTLHTVGTIETITRLGDMKIESYMIADTLRGVIAQRLVRRVCKHCKRQAEPNPAHLRWLGITEPDFKCFEGKGCDECHGSGYKGRAPIYEILNVSPEIGVLIQRQAKTDDIRNLAIEQGMVTLKHDAVRKVGEGTTSLAEALGATARG